MTAAFIDKPGVKSTEPGIYFGMSDVDYHAAFALSYSGIKQLRVSPLNFWAASPLNSEREDGETEATLIGRAYDKRIVEGARAFHEAYAPALDAADHPRALRTNDELREALQCAGIKATAKDKKADLIARLRAADPSAEVWDDIAAQHAAKHEGRTLLGAALIKKIEISAAMIEKHPQLGKAFTGGYPQVSIFWNDYESGVPMKARLDYLKARAVVDLKTFDNSMAMPVDRAIARTIASYKYHIQARLYLDAVREARDLIRAGRVFGCEDKDFLKHVAGSEGHTFMFVFQQKGAAPIARGKILPALTLDMGAVEINDAKTLFAENWKRYGSDPWVDVSEVQTFDATDFPAFITD